MAGLNVALVGAGNIAARYAACIAAQPALAFAGATDLLAARAEELVAEHGGRAYASLDDVLADDAVDVVVNLTVPSAHAEVTARCLEAGKHVHAEKPVALRRTPRRGRSPSLRRSGRPAELRAGDAARRGAADGVEARPRRVARRACAPRTPRRTGAGSSAGTPRPRRSTRSGPLVDVGIYPLTILTAMFGPARRVSAYATTLQPERTRSTASGSRSRRRTSSRRARARRRRRRAR